MRARDVIELSDNESEFSGSIALFKIKDDQSDSSVFGDIERDDTFAVPRCVSLEVKSSKKRNNYKKNVSRNPGVHAKIPTRVNGVASNASQVSKKTNSRNPSKNIKVLLDKISTSNQEGNSFSKDPHTYDKFSSSSKLPDEYLPCVLLERVSVPDKNFKSQEQPDDQQSKNDKISNDSHQDRQLRNLPFVLLQRIIAPIKRVNRADNILACKTRKSSNPTANSRKHELAVSIPDKKHKCDHCDFATNFACDLKRHMRIHFGGPLLKCTDCNFETLYFHSLKRHKRSFHDRKSLPVVDLHEKPESATGKKHKCNHCNYATNFAWSLNKHMKIHYSRPLLKCTDCNFETLYFYSLERHKRRFHDRKSLSVVNLHKKPESVAEKKHKCDHCNFETNNARSLNRHMKTHLSGPLFKCTDCNFETLYSNNLKKHKLLHISEPITCPYCPFATLGSRALSHHVRSHPVANQPECDICHLKFTRLYNLTIHRLNYHMSCATSDSKLTCSFCQEVFADKYSLMTHRKTYKSGNNFKCNKCSYTTRYSKAFKYHFAKHLNR